MRGAGVTWGWRPQDKRTFSYPTDLVNYYVDLGIRAPFRGTGYRSELSFDVRKSGGFVVHIRLGQNGHFYFFRFIHVRVSVELAKRSIVNECTKLFNINYLHSVSRVKPLRAPQ